MPNATQSHPLPMEHWQHFTPDTWAKAHKTTGHKPLNRADIDLLRRLAGTNEILDQQDIRKVYFPMSCVLLDQFKQKRNLNKSSSIYIIGISGSVAVGKSTGARLLTELLRRQYYSVELITTDNFLKPNAVLEAENKLKRKGFPDSYDSAVITQFLNDLNSEQPKFTIPTYDHIAYTILPHRQQTIYRPNILVLEGINVLQTSMFPLDYKLYFDADPSHIKQWYVDRFLTFRQAAFQVPGAYFERFAKISDADAQATASELWDTINLVNLNEHINPSRINADCIIHKNSVHQVAGVSLKHLDSNQ